MSRKFFHDATPLDEALKIWSDRLGRAGLAGALAAQSVAVSDSLGRITSEAVFARISSPFYHSSAMDGYAVNFTDTFGASETAPKRLTLGIGATYVDTGDPMPDALNAVIMVEDVTVIDGQIEFIAPVTPWQNVRTIGEDIVATELILPENQRIRPVDIGAMLAGGCVEINVRISPRVAIIPTGSELVEPGGELKRGEIIEYNSRMLAAMVTELGGIPIRMPIVKDDLESLKRMAREAAGIADLVIINAGSSMGSEDYTSTVISELGEVVLHGINTRPGKPVILGLIGDTPAIGLPGYPVSTFITFELFVRPLLLDWQGLQPCGAHIMEAALARQIASPLGQEEFVRMKVGRVGGQLVATPLGRGAGLMMSLVRADGFLRIPAMSEGLGAGAKVRIELIRSSSEIENTLVVIGSHDNVIDILGNFLRKRFPRYSLSSANVGSMGGLMAIKRGEAHMAPTHLLDEDTGEYNVPYLKRLMPELKVTLINLLYRTQGFMVPKGNPRGILKFEDLTRRDIVFINRQRGSGTRLLLDKHLRELSLDSASIQGYEREEYTHMAVASAVLTGMCDVGLGVLSAANALGLDFVPVAQERYDLAIPTQYLRLDKFKALLEVIRTDQEFKNTVIAMGGYEVTDMGKELWTSL